MNDFTYENKNSKVMYETYEWDNTWIENANDQKAKRVLYIGDSISCQTRRHCTEVANKSILFDGFGTSKGIDNPYLIDSIKLFSKQQPGRNAVLFNNGLHGWHLDDETEYKEYYELAVKFLLDEFKNIPVVLVLTTHVGDEEREKRVLSRNNVVKSIAEKYNLQVIDLYSESLKLHDCLDNYGVHFSLEANISLARKIVNDVNKII